MSSQFNGLVDLVWGNGVFKSHPSKHLKLHVMEKSYNQLITYNVITIISRSSFTIHNTNTISEILSPTLKDYICGLNAP